MNKLFTILFWGSIWGILEAVFGWAMHLLKFQAVGSVIFPVAMVILILAYQKLQSRSAVFAIAIIAAAFKLINFVMPGDMERVIVPFSCILVEGLVCSFLVPYLKAEFPSVKFATITGDISPVSAMSTFVFAVMLQLIYVL